MRTGRGTGVLTAWLAVVVLGGPLLAASSPAEARGGPLRGPVRAPAAVAGSLDDHTTPAEQAATEAGRAALAEASAAKRVAQKAEDAEREAALVAVAATYDGIAAAENFAVPERTEAAFRAGEILRTLKRPEEADARFARAVSLGEGVEAAREFAARALLERAHLLRRERDVEGALALYADVGRRFADQHRSAAHAMTWSGKLLLRDGKLEQGAELMKGFAEAFPEYAAEAVRNADVLAVAWYDSGDEPAAQAVLDWIRARMAPLLEGEDRQAGSVRTALEKMKVTDLLAGD